MKVIISIFVLLILAAFAARFVNAQRCADADPNLRRSPDERLVERPPDGGAIVDREDFLYDWTGRKWLKVGIYRDRKYRILGFVPKDFLDYK